MLEGSKTVLALGMFDGVHEGHRKIIATARELANAMGAVCCAYTFSNHPAELLGRSVKKLCTNEERVYLLEDAGADQVCMEPFSEEMLHMRPGDFIESLVKRWDLTGVVAGFNYSFGDGGEGGPDLLASAGKEKGFIVRILPAVEIEGETVSSSTIRNALEAGDIRKAAAFLGRSYSVSGTASVRDGIIRLDIDGAVALPREGTYQTQILTERGVFESTSRVFTGPDANYVESILTDPEMFGQNFEVLLVFRSSI